MSPLDPNVACVRLIVPSTERMYTKEARRERRRVHVHTRNSRRLEKLSVQRVECGRVELRGLFSEPATLIRRQRPVRMCLIDGAAELAVLHEPTHDAPIT